MNVRRCLGATALVSTVFLAGCTGDFVEDDEETGRAQQMVDGGTSGGTNGASSADGLALEAEVVAATNVPLLLPGTNKVNPVIGNALLAQPGGEGIFAYLVKCSVARHPGMTYVIWKDKPFYTKGYVTGLNAWLDGPLGPEGKNDLLTCLVTLYNPWGYTVPLALVGSTIRNDGLDVSAFTAKEAAWGASVSPDGVQYTIWPTEDFMNECEGNPLDALIFRACGLTPALCDVAIGGPYEAHCQTTATGITCDGNSRVITTFVETFTDLNPTCDSTFDP